MVTASPHPTKAPTDAESCFLLKKERWFWLVAVICAGLAGTIAFTTMLAARHGRQTLLDEEQAADAWNFYQAKSIKANILEAKVEGIEMLGATPNEANGRKAAEYERETRRLYKNAKALEVSAKEHGEQAGMYVRFVGFFHVCMAFAVIAVLLHRMTLLDRTSRGLEIAIRERHDLERKFVQAQKLEAVGRLAAGVAHDFNNLLTVINAYSERLVEGEAAAKSGGESARQIREAGLRGAALTRQLLAFTRKLPLSVKPVHINAVVESMCAMLRRLLTADIQFITQLDPSTGWTEADENQISQVVMNLCVNARDAMRDGGKLTIVTRNSARAGGQPTDTPVPSGGWVCIEVSDTGTGMSKEVLDQVFEPFFTTKEVGIGTGLGMSTCLQIVREHRGRIDIESKQGEGTKVAVYFPRIAHTEDQEAAEVPDLDLPGGTETILLAEDEPAVRELGALLLRELGYQVIEAEDGIAALAQLSAPGREPPALIVSDLVMPTIGGTELARRVSARLPEIPILFTSGYSGEDPALATGIRNPVAFLQKPYTPRALASQVRKLIDAGRSVPSAV